MPEDHFDDVSYELNLSESRELLVWARENIRETVEDRTIKLYQFKKMIYERDDVRPLRMDDAFLLRFLRRKKFNLTKTYNLLVQYYDFREKYPELCKGVNPFKLQYLADADVIQILPFREQTGRRITIYKAGNWKVRDYQMEHLIQATLMILQMATLEPGAQILGGIAIINLQGISLAHARQVTPGIASKLAQMLLSVPLRIHAIHVIFESWVVAVAYKIIKPFLTQKMRNKIFFHGNNVESLHKHIDPKYLPRTYGGIRPEYGYIPWVDHLIWREDVGKEMESLGYLLDQKEVEAWRGR